MSNYLEADIEFAFIRTQQQLDKSMQGFGSPTLIEPIECFSFYCQPNQMKVAADQVQILNIQIKVNTEQLMDEDKVDQKLVRMPINKLLVARLKNS